jgi:hypothetical protein
MPVVADGGTEEAGTHCSHQELKTMNLSDHVHILLPTKSGKYEFHFCSYCKSCMQEQTRNVHDEALPVFLYYMNLLVLANCMPF